MVAKLVEVSLKDDLREGSTWKKASVRVETRTGENFTSSTSNRREEGSKQAKARGAPMTDMTDMTVTPKLEAGQLVC